MIEEEGAQLKGALPRASITSLISIIRKPVKSDLEAVDQLKRIKAILNGCEQSGIDIAEFRHGKKKATITMLPIVAEKEDHFENTMYISILKILLASGAPIVEADVDGCTPLHLAAENGNVAAAKSLINYAAKKNLHVKLMQAMTVDVPDWDFANTTALMKAVKRSGSSPMVDLLISNTSRHALDAADEFGYTALHWCCPSTANGLCGSPEFAELLLKAGANVNSIDCQGATPICHAIATAAGLFRPVTSEHRVLPLIRVLLDHGADFMLAATGYDSPLEMAQKAKLKHILHLIEPAKEESSSSDDDNGDKENIANQKRGRSTDDEDPRAKKKTRLSRSEAVNILSFQLVADAVPCCTHCSKDKAKGSKPPKAASPMPDTEMATSSSPAAAPAISSGCASLSNSTSSSTPCAVSILIETADSTSMVNAESDLCAGDMVTCSLPDGKPGMCFGQAIYNPPLERHATRPDRDAVFWCLGSECQRMNVSMSFGKWIKHLENASGKTKRSTNEWNRIFIIRQAAVKSPFEINQRVAADYDAAGKWYSGTVVTVNIDGTNDILFDEDRVIEKNVPISRIRNLRYGGAPYEIKDRVEGNYDNAGKWYPGRIAAVCLGGLYEVAYDDGDYERGVPTRRLRKILVDLTAVEVPSPVFRRQSAVSISVETVPRSSSPTLTTSSSSENSSESLPTEELNDSRLPVSHSAEKLVDFHVPIKLLKHFLQITEPPMPFEGYKIEFGTETAPVLQVIEDEALMMMKDEVQVSHREKLLLTELTTDEIILKSFHLPDWGKWSMFPSTLKLKIAHQLYEFFRLEAAGNRLYPNVLLDVLKIPETDPRVALRNQSGIFARFDMQQWTVLGSFGGLCMVQKDFEGSKKSLGSMIQGNSFCYDIDVKNEHATAHLYKLLQNQFGSSSLTISPVSYDKSGKLCFNEMGFANDYRATPFEKIMNETRIQDKTLNAEIVNVYFQGWPVPFVVLIKDVKAGEEIVVDYGKKYWNCRNTEADYFSHVLAAQLDDRTKALRKLVEDSLSL